MCVCVREARVRFYFGAPKRVCVGDEYVMIVDKKKLKHVNGVLTQSRCNEVSATAAAATVAMAAFGNDDERCFRYYNTSVSFMLAQHTRASDSNHV